MSSIIVTFKDTVTQEQVKEQQQLVIKNGGKITNELESINGFSCIVPDAFVKSFLEHPGIDSVEADGEVSILGKSLFK